MPRVVSVTEARVRFSELMRWAVGSGEPIIIERKGKPYVVILSVEAYGHLQATQGPGEEEDVLARIRKVRAQIHARRGGEPVPPPEEIIREMREGRSAGLAGLS